MKKSNLKILVPVLLSFYIMGFVDLVGVGTAYIQKDFNLSATVAQLLPSMVFIWFALVSIPTGIFQDRKGRKLTVNIGMGVTGLGLIIPFISYSYLTAILGFMILGIGNTILQVSANPLLIDISRKGEKAANLSLSQFVKAIASMLGPIITAALALYFDNWKLIFPIYALLSVLSVLWLSSIKIEETVSEKPPASFSSILKLFRHKFVVVVVISIFLIVGFDVGINSNITNFLSTRFMISIESASIGISIYFASLMVGRFAGSILLRKINPVAFMSVSVFITLVGLAGVILSDTLVLSRISIFIAGLGFSNVFPIMFALALEKMPDYANEFSSLIILAVSGGALIPPIMGFISDTMGVTASIFVLVFCVLFVAIATVYIANSLKKAKLQENE